MTTNITLYNMLDYELDFNETCNSLTQLNHNYCFWRDMKKYVTIKNQYFLTISRLQKIPLHTRVLHKNHMQYVFKQYYLHESQIEVNDMFTISV